MKFDLPELDTDAKIDCATLQIYHQNTVSQWVVEGIMMSEDINNEGGMWNCSLFVARQAWVPNEVTWRNSQAGVAWDDSFPGNQIPFIKGGGNYDSSLFSAGLLPVDTTWVTFDVTPAVKSFIKNPSKNFGFILKDMETQRGYSYASSKNADIAKRPKLSLKYETTEIIPAKASSGAGIKFEAINGGIRLTFPHYGRYSAKIHDAKGRLLAALSGNGSSASLSGIGGIVFISSEFEGRLDTRSLVISR